jgi:hypothetical protein
MSLAAGPSRAREDRESAIRGFGVRSPGGPPTSTQTPMLIRGWIRLDAEPGDLALETAQTVRGADRSRLHKWGGET